MCHCLNVSSEFFKIPGVINGKTSEQLLHAQVWTNPTLYPQLLQQSPPLLLGELLGVPCTFRWHKVYSLSVWLVWYKPAGCQTTDRTGMTTFKMKAIRLTRLSSGSSGPTLDYEELFCHFHFMQYEEVMEAVHHQTTVFSTNQSSCQLQQHS